MERQNAGMEEGPAMSAAEAVLAEIRRTPGVTFGVLAARMTRLRGRDMYRGTDHALQSLRKGGRIHQKGRGKWFPAEPAAPALSSPLPQQSKERDQ